MHIFLKSITAVWNHLNSIKFESVIDDVSDEVMKSLANLHLNLSKI